MCRGQTQQLPPLLGDEGNAIAAPACRRWERTSKQVTGGQSGLQVWFVASDSASASDQQGRGRAVGHSVAFVFQDNMKDKLRLKNVSLKVLRKKMLLQLRQVGASSVL